MQAQHNTGVAINGLKAKLAPVSELITLIIWQILPYLSKLLRVVVNQELAFEEQCPDVEFS